MNCGVRNRRKHSPKCPSFTITSCATAGHMQGRKAVARTRSDIRLRLSFHKSHSYIVAIQLKVCLLPSMAQLDDLPAELVLRILEYTSPANLDSLSQVAHRWYSLATKRLRKHREYRSKFRTLHDGYAWLDVLVNIVQDPWIGHYVTHLSMNTKIRFRRGFLSDLNIPRHAPGTPDQWRIVKEAFMKSPFVDGQNSITFDRQARNYQEALSMALLITLLPNVQQLTMNVPTTWKGIKVIQNVVTQMAIAYHRKCPTEGGLISLRNIEFKGHCHRGRGRGNLSFAAPFIALPEASTLKLVQIGSGQFNIQSRSAVIECNKLSSGAKSL